MQVWTYKGRVAFVLSVLEKNKPIADRVKLQRLSQIMLDIMGGDLGIVTMDQVCLCFRRSGPCRSFIPLPCNSPSQCTALTRPGHSEQTTADGQSVAVLLQGRKQEYQGVDMLGMFVWSSSLLRH